MNKPQHSVPESLKQERLFSCSYLLSACMILVFSSLRAKIVLEVILQFEWCNYGMVSTWFQLCAFQMCIKRTIKLQQARKMDNASNVPLTVVIPTSNDAYRSQKNEAAV